MLRLECYCLTCRCAIYSALEAARHELEGHNVVTYKKEAA